MGQINRRFAGNRFSPLDTNLGFQNTAQGMTQDVYEHDSKVQSPVVPSPARHSLGSPRWDSIASANGLAGYQSLSGGLDPAHVGPVRYSLEYLLQLRRDSSRKKYIPAVPNLLGLNLDGRGVGPKHAAAHNDAQISLDVSDKPIRNGHFPYARLPFELRQMVLRELVPTKSIWNGTSFPKSCPKEHQQAYFEKTKYLQNRALAQ